MSLEKAITDTQTMAPSLDVAIIRDTVLDAALALSTDPIPNIRFNVAKCLETLAVQCTNDAEGQDIIHRRIVPALKKLQEEDTDADVRYVLSPFSSFLSSFLVGIDQRFTRTWDTEI